MFSDFVKYKLKEQRRLRGKSLGCRINCLTTTLPSRRSMATILEKAPTSTALEWVSWTTPQQLDSQCSDSQWIAFMTSPLSPTTRQGRRTLPTSPDLQTRAPSLVHSDKLNSSPIRTRMWRRLVTRSWSSLHTSIMRMREIKRKGKVWVGNLSRKECTRTTKRSQATWRSSWSSQERCLKPQLMMYLTCRMSTVRISEQTKLQTPLPQPTTPPTTGREVCSIRRTPPSRRAPSMRTPSPEQTASPCSYNLNSVRKDWRMMTWMRRKDWCARRWTSSGLTCRSLRLRSNWTTFLSMQSYSKAPDSGITKVTKADCHLMKIH